MALTSELLNIQVLTDTTVLQVSSLGVAPFFVENISELQLSALKLVTTVSAGIREGMRRGIMAGFEEWMRSRSRDSWDIVFEAGN